MATQSENINALAKDAIEKILKQKNIKFIVYVDDNINNYITKEEFLGILKSQFSKKPKYLDFVNWDLPINPFEQSVRTLYNQSTREEMQRYMAILKEHSLLEDPNTHQILDIKSHFPEIVKEFTPEDWLLNSEIFYSELEKTGGAALFLFDMDLSKAKGEAKGRNGLDLLKDVNSHFQGNNSFLSIFTGLITIDEECDYRNRLCKENGLLEEMFYPISKERFKNVNPLCGFAEGIKNAILTKEIELLKSDALNIFNIAFDKTKEQIKQLSPEAFNHIVQKSSREEGIWEVNTLFRLGAIISDFETRQAIVPTQMRENFNNYISKIREIEKISTGNSTPLNKSQIFSIRKKELYIDGNTLNSLHYPISNGDIFKIGTKEFILLSQPCNLAVRYNGKRNYDYDKSFLVELKTYNESGFNQLSFEKRKVMEEVDYFISDESKLLADFPSFKICCLDLFDLVVFNSEGNASIDLNVSVISNEVIHEAWLNRYKKVFKKFETYGKLIESYNQNQEKLTGESRAILMKSITKPDWLRELNLDGLTSYNMSSRKFNFKIVRVSHYKEPFSTDLLQKFMLYLSRNGFAHDFTC